jgi:VRR-NUC domain
MAKLLKSGDIPEESIHKTVMEWVRLHPILKGLVLHFPNEGRRTKRFGGLLKDLGMRAGVSDLLIAMQRHSYGGAWIELKSSNGVLSTFQKKFLEDMSQQNYFTAVCWSVDEAINTISWYCFENQKSISLFSNSA